MALVFEYEKELMAGYQPFISHEPDSVIYNYFVDNEMALDKNGTSNFGDYSDITFDNEARHLTSKAVTRIGIKNFPGIGGMGFYKNAYSDECSLVVPIHIKRQTLGKPMLQRIEIIDSKLHIVIAPPENMEYDCYRVVVRQGYFAFEYITYKTEAFVDVPTVMGEYNAYCFGYDESTGVISEYSNELPLLVESGSDSWAPYFETIHDIEQRVVNLETDMGDIGAILDEINGVEV